MSKKDMMKRVEALCLEVTDSLKFELVDVEYLKEHGDYFLRVYIHKDGGVNLDDCQAASELLSAKLDEFDIIDKAYYLEVSSPGLDRPIKTDKDFKRNIGKEVEVNLYQNLRDSKRHEGILKSFDDKNVILEMANGTLEIPRDTISLMRLTIKF